MPRPYTVHIRQRRPWHFWVRSWIDEDGNAQALADYSWQFVASTAPALDLAGSIDADGVAFARTADETKDLTVGSAEYAVKAMPVAGGEPVFVFEGPLRVERSAVG